MILAVDDKLISSEIFERKFVCDLNACKGACCVEGDAGAPLTFDEVDIMEEIVEKVKPFMRKEGIDVIEQSGVFYMDQWNQPATTLVNGNECAFVYFDENGISKCAFEQAYLEGKTTWKKPISCHLYPIRVSKINDGFALNYEEWKICDPACSLGEQLQVPVFKFLKEPLTRAYGEDFYADLEEIAVALKDEFKK
jgi:hypothetical protein